MRSKTLAHLFVWKLGEYVSADDVTVSLTDPGYVSGTSLHHEENFNVFLKAAYWLFSRAGRTPKVGSSTMVDTLVNKGKSAHESFMMSCKVAPYVPLHFYALWSV